MKILSWNIQCGLGCDGRVELERIAQAIRSFSDPDLLCLQEVARFMPELDQGEGADQAARLAALFPGFEPVFGPAIDRAGDRPGERRQFGNLILSRPRVVQAFRHLLPQPAAAGIRHMPRQAIEVVVEDGSGPLRVITTHLEFHSEAQRLAQARRLARLQEEVRENEAAPSLRLEAGPYASVPRPELALLCGDFNSAPGDAVHGVIGRTFADAWPLLHGPEPHAPTCGLFDRRQWPQGPHCRDFFFVTEGLRPRLLGLEVDLASPLSDHQPLLLRLA